MAMLGVLALLVVACASTPQASSRSRGTPTVSASPSFDDEFDGTSLTSEWVALDRQGDTGNQEIECYRPQNASVTGGDLVLTTRVGGGCGDSSAMVQWRSFRMHYGTLEVRALLPGGTGTWPAIWLLGSDCQQSNISTADNVGTCDWPQPGSDEIDFVEILGSNDGTVNEAVHREGSNPSCGPSVSNVSASWHDYELAWTPSSLTWLIDGRTTCTMTSSIPQDPMFLIINTALGGAGGSLNPSTLPQQMKVDWVRVYAPGGRP